MTTTRSRRVLVAGAAGFAAVGAASALVVANALSSPSVVSFAPAAATDDTATTAPKSGDPANCAGREPLDEATAAKVKAAAEKAVPNATVKRMGHDRRDGDGYIAGMEKADGTHVLLHEDANFNVTKVDDPAPARGHGRPGRQRVAPTRV